MSRRPKTLAPETVKLNAADVRDAIKQAAAKLAALVVLQGSESDIGTLVTLDRPVVLGRDPTVELTLQDEGISRRHCRVVFDGDHYVVEDLNSTNGTLLNGVLLSRAEQLQPGDRIHLGACIVKFTHSDAAEVGYHEQMDTLVGTDDLTGLMAKRRFDVAFQRAVEAAGMSRGVLSVMMLDLDGLKRINDTHGHPVGAHTISAAGRLIGEIVSRKGGEACRFGGDEFAAFLPGYSKAEAVAVGENIREVIGAHRFAKDEIVVNPTISIGVAAFPDDGSHHEKLLHRADEALYRAKNAGRNRVES